MNSAELKSQQRMTAMRGGLAFAISAAALVGSAIWLPGLVSFPVGSVESLLFACKVNLVPGIILMIAIRIVSRIRFRSPPDSRGSAYAPPSEKLSIPAAFLQNTLEQSVLFALATFGLATVARPSALAYMAAAAALFVIGRVAFWFGYAQGAGGRAFGMVMTMTPAIGALAWSAYEIVLE